MGFNRVYGHRSQIEALVQSVSKNRTAHAYLFTGPEGTGKKLTALQFAKVINCKAGNDPYSDCSCTSCAKADKHVHPDIHVFEYSEEKTIKVGHIREDIERIVYLSPYESRYKIFILDGAERMNFSAQNAFLKTLEEPPSNSVIILVTSLADLIIPTVRSRCRTVSFNRLSGEEIEKYLSGKGSYTGEELKLVAKISGGSIGKALGIDKDFLDSRKDYIEKLLKADPRKPSTIFEFAEQVSKLAKGSDITKLKQFFDILSVWISDSVSFKIGMEEEGVINSDMYGHLQSFSRDKSMKELMQKFSAIEESWNSIVVYNANKQLTIENLLVQLSS